MKLIRYEILIKLIFTLAFQKYKYEKSLHRYIHPGHLNIIKKGAELGEVIIGLLTDKAISSYKRLPYLTYDQREEILINIKGVSRVIKQESLDYTENLKVTKPDYVVHGDDWKEGIQKSTREKVINTLKEWNGQVIDVPYTKGINSTLLQEKIKDIGTTPDIRRKRTANCSAK